MQLYQVHALVLRARGFMEADRLVTLFSRERGKIQAVARGARRPRNRLSGSTGMFTFGIYQLYPGRNLANISQSDVIEPFGDLREHLDKIAYATYFAELVDRVTDEEQPQDELFTLLLKGFHVIDAGEALEIAARAFEMQLLDILGLKPEMERCVRCGGALDQTNGQVGVMPVMGGIICNRCLLDTTGCMRISRGALEALKRMAAQDLGRLHILKLSGEIQAEMDRMMQAFVGYHIDGHLPSRTFLETVRLVSFD